MINKLVFIITVFLFPLALLGQKSVFNDKSISINKDSSYRYIISGHFYGDGKNTSQLPANTLLANLNWINEKSNAQFIISLGDLFKDASIDPPFYKKYLFDPLQIPIFNAIGNHDIIRGEYAFGQRYYEMVIGQDLHLILDTELDNGSIKNEQLEWFKKQIKYSVNYNNVFIYSHRPVWGVSHPDFEGVFKNNTAAGSNNFYSDLLPLIKNNQPKQSVYWFGGSLGEAPASFLFHKTDEITYIATSIRSYPRDAVLIANVDVNGEVSFETFSLTGKPVEPIEAYSLDLWKEFNYVEPFNWKLIPLYIWNMITHRYFWYGLLYSLIGLFFIRSVYLFIKRKKSKA